MPYTAHVKLPYFKNTLHSFGSSQRLETNCRGFGLGPSILKTPKNMLISEKKKILSGLKKYSVKKLRNKFQMLILTDLITDIV